MTTRFLIPKFGPILFLIRRSLVVVVALGLSGCSKNDPAEKDSASQEPAPPSAQAPTPSTSPESLPPRSTAAEIESAARLDSPVTQLAPTTARKDYVGPLQDAYHRIDPSKDGWESEAFTEDALEQLHELEELILSPDLASETALEPITTPAISSDPLRPDELQKIFDDSRLVVQRAAERKADAAAATIDRASFAAQLQALGAGCSPDHSKIKLKIFRVEKVDAVLTRCRVLCSIDE